ncbi:iron chelate uptake ABC transporter family permease subunit [Vibrio sp. RC27]
MSSVKMTALFGVLLATSVFALLVGASNLSFEKVYQTLLFGGEFDFIINQYRLPRIVLALGVGAGLGIAGVLVQGVIRNPLASPDLMGVSAGAGLAATTLLVLKPDSSLFVLSLSSMGGGIMTAIIIAFIAKLSNPTPSRLALIGISISAFLASCIDYLLIVHPIEINTAMVWLTGSLWGRNWSQVPFLWASLVVILPVAFWLAWRLDILGLGEPSAKTLGTNPEKVQVYALVLAVLLTAISVSICGTISFVGLLAPHLSRFLFGHFHKMIIPGAAAIGALMILAADTVARGIQPPLELPAGVLTSLIGAPYFIFLLRRYRGWQ